MKNKVQVIVPNMTGIEKTKAAEIKALFQPMLDTMVEYEAEFNHVLALKDSPEKIAEARKLRLQYVKVRTGTAKIHKAAKAYHLAAGKAIDGFKNAQLFAGQEIEEELTQIEKYEEIEKAKQAGEIAKKRGFDLAEFGVPVIAHPPMLGEWSEDIWIPYLDGIKARYKQMKEDALQADAKAKAGREMEIAEQAAKDAELIALRKQAAINEISKVAPLAGVTKEEVIAVVDEINMAMPHDNPNSTLAYDEVVDLGTGEITKVIKDDQQLALELILDLNNLANKYTFYGDQYRFAYGKMGERMAAMEKHLRMLNKAAI